jgi:glycosyltransferase involved in cell wall biosynthesis
VKRANFTHDDVVTVFLCFEGPDRYSQAGGLGVRAANLTRTLAENGIATHLFFIGDPALKGEETGIDGRLVLHRWGQWLSQNFPGGVYHGEEEKIKDYQDSIPGYVTERVIQPAMAEGKLVFVLAEEWQTAETVCRLHDRLVKSGDRERVVMFWNTNSTFGFDRIDWPCLTQAATITTVSRYMKHIMWPMGLNPLVIPNGIPRELLGQVSDEKAEEVRDAVDADVLLCKIARWHPDKRWPEAIETVAALKEDGVKAKLIARGGSEPYGEEIVAKARSLGLNVREAHTRQDSPSAYIKALRDVCAADIIDVKFFLPVDFSRIIYHAADGVLANSGHEPFGIVGLETMAAGGIAYTGGTGEDYAIPFVNAFVLETADPQELIGYINELRASPEIDERMRQAARHTARNFTWDAAMQNLINKLTNQARAQDILSGRISLNPLPLLETTIALEEALAIAKEVA